MPHLSHGVGDYHNAHDGRRSPMAGQSALPVPSTCGWVTDRRGVARAGSCWFISVLLAVMPDFWCIFIIARLGG